MLRSNETEAHPQTARRRRSSDITSITERLRLTEETDNECFTLLQENMQISLHTVCVCVLTYCA